MVGWNSTVYVPFLVVSAVFVNVSFDDVNSTLTEIFYILGSILPGSVMFSPMVTLCDVLQVTAMYICCVVTFL